VYSLGMADFTGEEVIQVVLSGRQCENANLSVINLSNADLSNTMVVGATYTTKTKWPEGFDPVAARAVLVKDDD